MRIPYMTYPQATYPMVRQLLYKPIPYQSVRVQTDIIQNTSSIFTQRISIGGASLINGVICFFVPRFSTLSGTVRPQDCIVDYEGCNVPSLGDARYIASLDSCYLPFTQFSVQLDQKTYEANPLIPIASQ